MSVTPIIMTKEQKEQFDSFLSHLKEVEKHIKKADEILELITGTYDTPHTSDATNDNDTPYVCELCCLAMMLRVKVNDVNDDSAQRDAIRQKVITIDDAYDDCHNNGAMWSDELDTLLFSENELAFYKGAGAALFNIDIMRQCRYNDYCRLCRLNGF